MDIRDRPRTRCTPCASMALTRFGDGSLGRGSTGGVSTSPRIFDPSGDLAVRLARVCRCSIRPSAKGDPCSDAPEERGLSQIFGFCPLRMCGGPKKHARAPPSLPLEEYSANGYCTVTATGASDVKRQSRFLSSRSTIGRIYGLNMAGRPTGEDQTALSS